MVWVTRASGSDLLSSGQQNLPMPVHYSAYQSSSANIDLGIHAHPSVVSPSLRDHITTLLGGSGLY